MSAPARPPGDTLAEIVAAFAPLEGRRLVDIGSGGGRLAAALAARGARVVAVDPDPAAAAGARGAAPGVLAVRAAGEALPFADAAFAGAIFLNSLHHVPPVVMGAALREAARVVRKGGAILVVEPLAEGGFFEAMRPLEDETEIRGAAQDAVARAVADGAVALVRCIEYERLETLRGLDAFLERLVAAEPARAAVLPGARESIAARFARYAEPHEKGFLLRQPMRLHHLARS